MLHRLTILFCFALLAPPLQAQPEFVTMQSLSKQFVIYGPKAAPKKLSSRIPLDPALTAVSCERIKQAIFMELGGLESWRLSNEQLGTIYVVLHPTRNQAAVITPAPAKKTFSYRVDLPNDVEAAQFVEAITQVVLLEFVNRRSMEQVTQIPLWLVKGVSAQVQVVALDALVLEPNKSQGFGASSMIASVNGDRRIEPISDVRQALKNCNPLSFDELCWPGKLSAERAKYFEKSAQLFLYELLRIQNGKSCLMKMLAEMPNNPNWQIAFLHAFSPHFKGMVDVEKWWSLILVNITGRDPSKIWLSDQSVEHIDAILKITVQTRDAVPGGSDSSLQEIISKWEPARQKPVLLKILGQLRALRTRIQPEAVALADEYCSALDYCLKNGQKDPIFVLRPFSRTNAATVRQLTCARLDELDEERSALRKKSHPSTREEAVLSALEAVTQRPVPSTKR